MSNFLKLLGFNTIRRTFKVYSPSSCSSKDGDGKSPETPPPAPRRRPMLSPEDRIRGMLDNVSDTQEPLNDKNKHLLNPLPKEDDMNVRKSPMPRRFSRRRSLSPMARIQGMMDDQGENVDDDKNPNSDKDTKSDKDIKRDK